MNTPGLPEHFPSLEGRAHRAIDIRTMSEGQVTAWLEDDFHHFGVTIFHNGESVTDVAVATPRHPYTTCASAGQPLRALVGAPLVERASDVGRWINMREQCTHVFDLAGLAMAHAAAGRKHRRYQTTIDDRPVVAVHTSGQRTLGSGRAALLQDGVEVMNWDIDRYEITSPETWAGQSLKKGFRAKTETLALDPAEHATILRRSIMVAGGRSADRDTVLLPRENSKPAVCHTYQPAQRPQAEFITSSVRDWSDAQGELLKAIDLPPKPKR
ncbi:MAG: hypothetical protein ACI9GB_001768 [Halioglobus sp.]|jgi:hypothetical protein